MAIGRKSRELDKAIQEARSNLLEITPSPFQANPESGCELRLTIRVTKSAIKTKKFHSTINVRGITVKITPLHGKFDKGTLGQSLDYSYFNSFNISTELTSERKFGSGVTRNYKFSGQTDLSEEIVGSRLNAEIGKQSSQKSDDSMRGNVLDSHSIGTKFGQFSGDSLHLRFESRAQTRTGSTHEYLYGRLISDEEPVVWLDTVNSAEGINIHFNIEFLSRDIDFDTLWKENTIWPSSAKEKLEKILLIKLITEEWNHGNFKIDWHDRKFYEIDTE